MAITTRFYAISLPTKLMMAGFFYDFAPTGFRARLAVESRSQSDT
jgi:hypothetical protein